MSYSWEDHLRAMKRWIIGETIEQLAQDPSLPSEAYLEKWKDDENWENMLYYVQDLAKDALVEELTEAIVDMNETQIKLARNLYAHIQKQLTMLGKTESGELKALEPIEIQRLATALDKATKVERTARELPTEIIENHQTVDGNVNVQGNVAVMDMTDRELREYLWEANEEFNEERLANGDSSQKRIEA